MPPSSSIGDQELALLQHIAEHGDSSVAEAAARFGEPRGLARSTVLTMMERLRKKGYLTRRPVDGVYRYVSSDTGSEVMQGAVARFVSNTLRGSVSPFVAWMSRRSEVSEDELQQLEHLVAQLRAKKKEDGQP